MGAAHAVAVAAAVVVVLVVAWVVGSAACTAPRSRHWRRSHPSSAGVGVGARPRLAMTAIGEGTVAVGVGQVCRGLRGFPGRGGAFKRRHRSCIRQSARQWVRCLALTWPREAIRRPASHRG